MTQKENEYSAPDIAPFPRRRFKAWIQHRLASDPLEMTGKWRKNTKQDGEAENKRVPEDESVAVRQCYFTDVNKIRAL